MPLLSWKWPRNKTCFKRLTFWRCNFQLSPTLPSAIKVVQNLNPWLWYHQRTCKPRECLTEDHKRLIPCYTEKFKVQCINQRSSAYVQTIQKVEGAVHKSKVITTYPNNPYFVMKAVLCSSSPVTCIDTLCKSVVENILLKKKTS